MALKNDKKKQICLKKCVALFNLSHSENIHFLPSTIQFKFVEPLQSYELQENLLHRKIAAEIYVEVKNKSISFGNIYNDDK